MFCTTGAEVCKTMKWAPCSGSSTSSSEELKMTFLDKSATSTACIGSSSKEMGLWMGSTSVITPFELTESMIATCESVCWIVCEVTRISAPGAQQAALDESSRVKDAARPPTYVKDTSATSKSDVSSPSTRVYNFTTEASSASSSNRILDVQCTHYN